MRKIELEDRISKATGIPRVDVHVILDTYFKEVKTSLIEGEPITIRGFGSFILKKRRFKVGRVITRGVPIDIPEHIIPAFKPAKEFKEAAIHSKPKREWKYERKAKPNAE
jgi:DNA-binding protein HU-beta